MSTVYDVVTRYVAVAPDGYESAEFDNVQEAIDHADWYGTACVVERTYHQVSHEFVWHYDHPDGCPS